MKGIHDLKKIESQLSNGTVQNKKELYFLFRFHDLACFFKEDQSTPQSFELLKWVEKSFNNQ